MPLDFGFEERELLLEILQEHQRELLRELAHTDHREFRTSLREKVRTLERVLDKLAAVAAA
jgi:hypothetical protein